VRLHDMILAPGVYLRANVPAGPVQEGVRAPAQSCSRQDDAIGGLSLEDKAMDLALEDMFEETGRRWKPWASNGKSVRVGTIVLLVDSDTIVPEDCFRDAARVRRLRFFSTSRVGFCFFLSCEVLWLRKIRCHASRPPLLREWDRIFHAEDQRGYFGGLRKRRRRAFSQA
jgi:hypothetical protein